MKDSTNICLACGICCDGTLIGFVEVSAIELERLKGVKKVETKDGHGFFLQPCDKYCNGCTIYSQRPKHCDSFNCKLLKSVQEKKLHFDVAVKIVDDAKSKTHAIEKKIAALQIALKSPSFYFKMVELKKVINRLEEKSNLTSAYQALRIDLEELDELLLENFGVTMD